MSTSGSYDFSMNRNAVIRTALGYLGNTTVQADEYDDASTQLNMLLKHWAATKGFKLWKLKELTLFVSPGTQSYSIGPSGDHATESFVTTTVASDYASGTSISLTSTSGMTNADNIGVELDDGTIEWTTISAVGSPLTLASGFSGAATAGNNVYAYTSKPQRPIEISNVRYASNGAEVPVHARSRQEYMDLVNKTSQGRTVQVHYQPTLTNGTLYVWPTGDSVDDLIKFTAKIQIEDMDALGDDFDFPPEWYLAITWNLAKQLMIGYGVEPQTKSEIRAMAEQALFEVESADQEFTSLFFEPEYR